MDIELLVVPDCPNEPAAAELVRRALADTGVRATVTRSVIATEDEARRRGFIGSPTIRVDGRDPFAQPGTLVGLSCRLYQTPDGLAGVPSLPDLRQALKRAADRN